MGKVVPLEGPDGKPRGTRARRRSRRRGDKTALVLGGGGFTGGVYEIGALRALDLLAVNSTVNDFDVYVGTSAGSFVGSMVANGVTPEEMMRVLNKALPSPIHRPTLRTLLRPNYSGWASRLGRLPFRAAGTLRHVIGNLGEVSMMDVATGLAEGVPTGLYHNKGIERYMREVLSDPDRSNDFRAVRRELYLVATDLDTSERIVFGKGDWADVPISSAVAASGALPIVYEPVGLKGRQLIDGGIASTTNVDIAVEAGAKFIVVVNPLVPYVNDFQKRIPTIFGSRVRRVSDMGVTAIANQTFRLMAHARLQLAVESWQHRFPDVDIILIEPELDDELMFGTSILDYSARLAIAKHGFESVTRRLADDYERYREIAGRHGLEISARRVRKVLDTVEEEVEGVSAWRRVLEQTTGALLRQSGQESEAAESGR
ncbi:MAG TPA: patatin-like phospholipase family protein [Solirubrobacterales bacterium]|jgi:predicted acylesterase/phospholipase RssA|nr:patatin-like phospholipase family protein [Solirubrobacterales bacterium]